MRTRESEVRPQTRQIRTCTSSRCPGDLSVHFISRRAALESSLCWKRKKVVFLKIPIRKEREKKKEGGKRKDRREKKKTITHINEMDTQASPKLLSSTQVLSFERSSISNWKTSGSQPASRGGACVSFERATLELGKGEGLRGTAGGRATGKRGTPIPSASR